MKTFSSVLVFLIISTMSFAQMAMNIISDNEMEITSKEMVMTDKAISQLAAQQTQSIARKLGRNLSTQLAYSDLMIENAMEGTLLLKLSFTPSGEVASIMVIESPHSLLSAAAIKVIDSMDLDGFVNAPYYGPDSMIIPICFSLR